MKVAVEGLLCLAAAQVKKNGSFKVGAYVNLKLKKVNPLPARKGVKGRQASWTVNWNEINSN